MSTWEANGAADNPILGWSSLSEMVWKELEGNGDHTVAKTHSQTQSAWALKDDSISKSNNDFILTAAKILDQKSPEVPKSCCSGLDSREELFSNLNRQAVLPLKEISPVCLEEVPWSEYTGNPNSIKQSDCSSLVLSEFGGGSKEVNKESEFESSNYMVEGTEPKVDPVYLDDDGDIANGSSDFLLPDICPRGGELEFLGEVQEDRKGSNLLEYGWGNANNLGDVDRLFLNSDSSIPQDFNDRSEEILWESCSTVIGSVYQVIRKKRSSEFRPLKGDFKEGGTEMEFVPCESPRTPMIVETHPERKEQSIPSNGKLHSTSDLEKPRWRSQPPSAVTRFLLDKDLEFDDNIAPKKVEKTSKIKLHAAHQKRLEERTKKKRFVQKSALNSRKYSRGNNSKLLYMPSNIQSTPSSEQNLSSPSTPVSQISQSPVSEPPSSRIFPQPVPYLHAGFVFPAHHMPTGISAPSTAPQQLHQAQPLSIGYRPILEDAFKPQPFRTANESFSTPPVRRSSMTPQEKIEKLRWRQKMQAHLVYEQRQHLQLMNQHIIWEQKNVQSWHHQKTQAELNGLQEVVSGATQLGNSQASEGLVGNEETITKAESTAEEENALSAADVLQQLLFVASKLDPRTSLCLRDGFRRLARSALERHALGEISGNGSINDPYEGRYEHKTSSTRDWSSTKRILTVTDIVETETNPIDRFIARLLFHKRHPPLSGPSYMKPNSSVAILEIAEVALPHQIPWP